METETSKIYSAPAITLELDLETRAGSSTIGGFDPWGDLEK